MFISEVFETPDGDVKFEGNLGKEEVAYLLNLGIALLFQKGMIPVKVITPNDKSIFAEMPDGVQ